MTNAGSGEHAARERVARERVVRESGPHAAGELSRRLYRALSDEHLVLAMRAGDPQAMDEYVERHRPLLREHARRAGFEGDDGDEVVLAVLEQTAARLCRWNVRIPDSLGAYVVRSLSNRMANVRRDAARRDKALHSAASDAGEYEERVVLSTCSESTLRASRGPEWEPAATLPQALQKLAAALDRGLTEAERDLLLWERNRVPKRTIAEWTGMRYEATKQRIRRLRLRLKNVAAAYVAELPAEERDAVRRFIGAEHESDDGRDDGHTEGATDA
ncbi:MAG: hypothetical protein WKG32_13990 [Gemmatimonadaceae bacterium]